jgi:LacI family transcriptional regulator
MVRSASIALPRLAHQIKKFVLYRLAFLLRSVRIEVISFAARKRERMSSIDALPKYLLLAQELEDRIRAGDWAAGKIPTVRGIAERHDVSIVTASRALQVLRDKGLVRTIERSGCYLVPPTPVGPERWALCLRITPGPFQQASAAVSSTGFEAVARQGKAAFVTDAFDLRDGTSEEDLNRQARAAVAASLRGVFLLPSRVSKEFMQLDEWLLSACRAHGLPVVLIERNLRGVDRPLECDLVCSDDVEGGRLCTRHMLEGGRRRIAFVIGSPTSSHRDRLAGYLYALHAAGAAAVPFVLEQPADLPTKEAYARLTDRLLKHRANGVVCYQDYTAIGIILELLRRGLGVPRDLAVAGFDNLPIGDTFSIGVTTYAFPSEGVAAQALRVMEQRIKEPDAPPVKVIVPGRLIVRDSTGPAC